VISKSQVRKFLQIRRRSCRSPGEVDNSARGFTFRAFAPETLAAAQKTLIAYLSEGAIQPTIAKVFPLSDAADAVRHLIEDRPFGRVLMRVRD
jgi:NADPH:quinone reductase-like Zn-dependent oxidoreductase